MKLILMSIQIRHTGQFLFTKPTLQHGFGMGTLVLFGVKDGTANFSTKLATTQPGIAIFRYID